MRPLILNWSPAAGGKVVVVVMVMVVAVAAMCVSVRVPPV